MTATQIQKAIGEANLLPVGVGCDFGEVIMGDLGQDTLIGAPVNFAARMCDSAGKGEVAITKRLFETLSEDLRETIIRSFSAKQIKVKIKPKDPELEGILLQKTR